MTTERKIRQLRKGDNRVTLFFPSTNPGVYPPMSPPLPNLGIGYIGTVLKKNGYDVRCVDGNVLCPNISTDHRLQEEYVMNRSLETIEKASPDVLGVGSWTVNFPFAAELVSRFASRHPDTLIVLGGYQATFLPEFVLNFLPQVDLLALGEGEQTMLELMRSLETGKGLEEVNGLAWRKGSDVVKTPARALIPDLTTLPLVDYSVFVDFDPARERTLMLLTSRGCPYNCRFCSCKAFWRRIRTRRAEDLIEELVRLRNEYGIESFGICDDLFTVSTKRVVKFCEMLGERNISMDWNFNSRIDTLGDDSVVGLLLRSGVSRVCLGLESMNVDTLRFIGEAHPEEYFRTALKLLNLCLTDGVPLKFSTIVGFPNETEKDVTFMLDFAARLLSNGVAISTGLPVCYPGTGLWDMYERGEIRLVRISDPQAKRNSSGMFAWKYEHLPECVPSAWMIVNPHVPAARLQSMIRDFYGPSTASSRAGAGEPLWSGPLTAP